MEDQIQFVAKYEDWTAVKKITVEKSTRPIDIAIFLAGLADTFDRRIESNVRKMVDLAQVDKYLKEKVKSGKTESDVSAALAQLNSRDFSKLVNDLCANAKIEKPEGVIDKTLRKENDMLNEMIRVYASRKVLDLVNLSVDYSGVAKIIKPPKKGASDKPEA